MTYKDLANCKKEVDETWEEFTLRYGKIVDILNKDLKPGMFPYLKMSVIKGT